MSAWNLYAKALYESNKTILLAPGELKNAVPTHQYTVHPAQKCAGFIYAQTAGTLECAYLIDFKYLEFAARSSAY